MGDRERNGTIQAPPSGVTCTGDSIASRLGQVSWAILDCGRTPYVLLVTTYLFAPYFTNTLVDDPVRGQAIWGGTQGYAGIVIAVLAPFLGAIADAGGRRKPWIAVFLVIMASASAALWYARPDHSGLSVGEAAFLVAAANVAYEFSSVFYNALLPSIVPSNRVGVLSGWSLAFGSLSSLLILIVVLVLFVLPGRVPWGFLPAHPLFGIDPKAHEAERLTGPISAAAIVLFALPLMIWTPDPARRHAGLGRALVKGIGSVVRTLRSLRHYRNVATYLLARLLFNDGMTTLLVFSGVYASGVFHWGALEMAAYGIIVSIFAVLGGFVGGWLDRRLGSRIALFLSVGGTLVLGLILITMAPDRIFWLIPYDPQSPPVHHLPLFKSWPELIYLGITNIAAVCVSASYANARTMMARIAPVERITEFFGLYSLSGQSTAFLATLGVGFVTAWSHSQRAGFSVVFVFLALGLAGLVFVREERATPI